MSTIELIIPQLRAWLTRDEAGTVSLWHGPRREIYLCHRDAWDFRSDSAGDWLWVRGNASWTPKEFCKQWKIEPADLPEPGTCKYVKIQVPD